MDAKALFIYSTYMESDFRNEIEHTSRAVALCEKFADEFSDDVDRQLLIDAAWLHDVAKYSADDDHHKPKKVKKVIKKYAPNIAADDLDAITEIISAHKGDFEPNDYALESAILRICDKLDRFNKGKDDAQDQCRKSMKKIKNSKALDDLTFEKFDNFYKKLLAELSKQ